MKKMVVLAGAMVLALSGTAFAQGGTVGGPAAAGAPQPSTSNPDTAVLPNTAQKNMKKKTGHEQPANSSNMGTNGGK